MTFLLLLFLVVFFICFHGKVSSQITFCIWWGFSYGGVVSTVILLLKLKCRYIFLIFSNCFIIECCSFRNSSVLWLFLYYFFIFINVILFFVLCFFTSNVDDFMNLKTFSWFLLYIFCCCIFVVVIVTFVCFFLTNDRSQCFFCFFILFFLLFFLRYRRGVM